MRFGCKGLTLVELISVVAIMGILVGVGYPSLRDWLSGARQHAIISLFVSSTYYARSEAMSRSAVITMCRSADGIKCGGQGGWERGWLTFVDSTTSGKLGIWDPEEPILARQSGEFRGVTFLGNKNVRDRVSFRASGIAKPFPGSFTVCDGRGAEHARILVIAWAGRIRFAQDTDGNGVPNLPSGKDMTCDGAV